METCLLVVKLALEKISAEGEAREKAAREMAEHVDGCRSCGDFIDLIGLSQMYKVGKGGAEMPGQEYAARIMAEQPGVPCRGPLHAGRAAEVERLTAEEEKAIADHHDGPVFNLAVFRKEIAIKRRDITRAVNRREMTG